MRNLANLLEGLEATWIRGDQATEIQNIQFDSRKVRPGDLFVAIPGTQTDGHRYIDTAFAAGARAVLCETLPPEYPEDRVIIHAKNSARTMGELASRYFGNPSQELNIVGVTGTNGKTSTVTLLYNLFTRLGYQVGLLSTVENRIKHEVLPSEFTTPDSLQIHRLMAQMREKGCTHCFMEVSSHALVQERVAGVAFDGAIFSNISHDHLDFHHTFLEYIEAKKLLFDQLRPEAFALVNADDKRGQVMLQNCPAKTQKTFALHHFGDFETKILENSFVGLQLSLDGKEVWTRLIGEFNAYNLLSVFAAATLLGEDAEQVLPVLSSLTPPPGRFEQIVSPQGTVAIVDYSHTPDSLKNVLRTLNDIRIPGQRIFTVVGCGGNRDAAKRPEMAKIAQEYSDYLLLTSDNPRNEDPMAILQDMEAGLQAHSSCPYEIIENRQEAIARACALAGPDDLVLVAGKGHETYQEIQGVKHPFDDRMKVKECFSLA